jgi:MSHA biogenesis protein MshO
MTRLLQPSRRPGGGFTLIELTLVIVIAGILAATIAVFMRPAIDSYIATGTRAELTDQADTALRRMLRDIRLAVPNSVRTPGSQCVEVLPTASGGRLRMGPDTVNDVSASCAPGANCAAALDTSQATTVVDVLTPLATTPAVGDWLVLGNLNPNDVYAGVNRAAITAVSTPAATQGRVRLTIASTQFPSGYDSGRFTIVSNAQKGVFYTCTGADGTVNASGDGKGTLYRSSNYGFNAAYPSSCPSTAGADIVATRVKSCTFVYDPNPGATQQYGFVWLDIELARNNETVGLASGAHVVNAP